MFFVFRHSCICGSRFRFGLFGFYFFPGRGVVFPLILRRRRMALALAGGIRGFVFFVVVFVVPGWKLHLWFQVWKLYSWFQVLFCLYCGFLGMGVVCPLVLFSRGVVCPWYVCLGLGLVHRFWRGLSGFCFGGVFYVGWGELWVRLFFRGGAGLEVHDFLFGGWVLRWGKGMWPRHTPSPSPSSARVARCAC